MARSSREAIASDDIPELPPFESKAYDVLAGLDDGSVEIIKVMARGPCMAMITALYNVQRWPIEKIAKIVSLNL